jgi:hypothetical protein
MRRQWRTAGVTAAVASGLAAAGALVVGPGWPSSYLALVRSPDYLHNEVANAGHYSVSVIGLAQHFFDPTGIVVTLTTVAAWAIGGLLLLLSWRHADPTSDRFPFQFGFAVAVGLLISPHALYYETALLVLPVIALVDLWYVGHRSNAAPGLAPRRRWALIGLHLSGVLWSYAVVLGVEPLILLVLGMAVVSWRILTTESAPSPKHVDILPADLPAEQPKLVA